MQNWKLIVLFVCCWFKPFAQDWVSLSQDVNYSLYHLNVFNGNLIAGGHFTLAGNAKVRGIAQWDGSSWSGLGKGVANGYVVKTIVFNNELYAIGNFDSAGTVKAVDIAKWDGISWSALGQGTNKNSGIFSIAVYNNQIHVAGTFDSIGGIAAKNVASWDGQNWHSLGTGLQAYGAGSLCEYNNELYLLAANMTSAGGVLCKNIARWNGSNWNNVGQELESGNELLYEWKGKLLAATEKDIVHWNGPNGWEFKYFEFIHQWDGSNWSLFSRHEPYPDITSLYSYKNKLYSTRGAGGVGDSESSRIMVWDESDSLWKKVGTGINDHATTLCEYKGELYCGGFFNKANGAKHNYIAKWSLTAGVNEFENNNSFIHIFPNPTSNYLYIKSKTTEYATIDICIFNSLGQNVYEQKNISLLQTNAVNISKLDNGVYFVRLTSGKNSTTHKVMINR